jgi:hypothetical protein
MEREAERRALLATASLLTRPRRGPCGSGQGLSVTGRKSLRTGTWKRLTARTSASLFPSPGTSQTAPEFGELSFFRCGTDESSAEGLRESPPRLEPGPRLTGRSAFDLLVFS